MGSKGRHDQGYTILEWRDLDLNYGGCFKAFPNFIMNLRKYFSTSSLDKKFLLVNCIKASSSISYH